MMKESIKFIRVREVHVPTRANAGDAGIDFYIPTNLNELASNLPIIKPYISIYI